MAVTSEVLNKLEYIASKFPASHWINYELRAILKELHNMNNGNPKTAPAPSPAVYWALWVQGRPGPTVRHQSYESAANEARRLIIQNPSIKVDILKLIETAQATVPPIEYVDAGTGVRRFAA